MATVSTSLKMFDMMTRPLQQVTNALNSTELSMNRVANRNSNMISSLNATNGKAQGATVGFNQLTNAQNKATNGQNNLNNSLNKGMHTTDGLMNKVKGLVGAYLGFQAIRKGIDLTIVGAANLEQQLITISGMLGNKDVGKAFFEKINDYALISQYGLKDFAAISRQFIQFTKNTDKLMGLNKLAERLAFLDPTQGLEGAGFALKEILGGDGMSLKGRFGFKTGEIKQLKEATSMDDFIKKFDHMVSGKGGTQKAVEEAANAASSLWNNLMANISTSFAKTGNRALEVMKPALQALNEAFREGKFQPFFNGLATGLSFVVDMIMLVATFIYDNVGIIKTAIVGLAITAIAYALLVAGTWIAANIAYATTAIGCALLTAQAWIIAHWPLLVMIAIILVLIGVMMNLGITTGQVVGFIGGIFGVLGAFIFNIVGFVWNNFASLAEFLLNVFNHPLYSIQKLFADIWNGIVDLVANAVGGIIDLINLIPGIDINTGGMSKAFKVDAGKPPSDYKQVPKMAMKDLGDSFKFGYGKGSNLAKGLKMPDIQSKMPDMDAWNKAHAPGNLGMAGDPSKLGKNAKDANKHLKNIDDKIDVSNEHLEMLRDLAEQESIQNFVTLTPNINFGDVQVKEEADINKIIDKIESYMENELVNSAEGVYA